MNILRDRIVPPCLQSKSGTSRPAVRAWVRRRLIPAALAAGCIFWIAAQSSPTEAERKEEAIWQHRNLGKAFFENPTTQLLAVDEFKAALDLAPDSPRERLNYGLSLLKAGRMAEGVAELEKAQQQAPDLPQTYFNLGMVAKKDAKYDRALQQLEKMAELVPDEPKTRYNLGVLYKLTGKPERVLEQFEAAARLDPNLAGPRFQLANLYRTMNRAEDADRELKTFQEIKKRQAGAAVPEDLEWSPYAEIYDPVDSLDLASVPAGPPAFADSVLARDLKTVGPGLAVLDADSDGATDLLAWSAEEIRIYRKASQLQNTGIAGLKEITAVVPGDFNNDGQTDLCITGAFGAVLYGNNKGSFQKSSLQLPSGNFRNALWIDYDHDGDADLMLLGDKSALARNNGAAGFSDITSEFPFTSGRAVDGIVFDLIKDATVSDIVLVYQDRNAVLYKDRLAGKYAPVELAVGSGARMIEAFDIDNDGTTDLAMAGEARSEALRNREGSLEPIAGPAGARAPILFADLQNRGAVDLVAGASAFTNQGLFRFSAGTPLPAVIEPKASVADDFNADGRIDLALLAGDGSLHLLTNQTASQNTWMQVGLLGVRNPALAPGSQVEVKAGGLYQKRLYQGTPLLFGLRSYKQADTVRITWPNLLIQNEPRQPAGKAIQYKEKQRLSGSCPMLFTWNGREFEFITDILGSAPLGVSAGEGKYLPVDHEEYIQIPGSSLARNGSSFEIRITEELHEIVYLDRMRLLAVDHPSDMEIATSEKFQGPPFPPLSLYGIRSRQVPISARDGQGNDLLARVVAKDRKYVDNFKRDFAGEAEPHSLELDFGPGAAPDNRAILVLHGWFDWADGSAFLRASQELPGGLANPYLQVRDRKGRWQTVVPDMGIPTGKPKTIVVDLTGKFLSEDRTVRIVTNLCVYWDQIFLSGDPSPLEIPPTEVVMQEAALRFGGFSALTVHPERKEPEQFDYARRSSVSSWNPTEGMYTRYGSVIELLDRSDDRFVIMGSGDELVLRFRADELPRLPEGWSRDFLFFTDGWAKDADLNTALSQSVNPLPFHGMSSYPYPDTERYPSTPEHLRYLDTYNIRPALRLLRPLAPRSPGADGSYRSAAIP